MVKRGASSMMGRTPEERGPEETSRIRADEALEKGAVISVEDKTGDTDVGRDEGVSGDRKRLRRDGESTPRLRIKRPRESVARLSGNSSLEASYAKNKGVELVDETEVGLDAVVRAVRSSYGQVPLLS